MTVTEIFSNLHLMSIINFIITSALSILTGYLGYKLRKKDQNNEQYRKEAEEKEKLIREKREAQDGLNLAMARVMLLNKYEQAMAKGYYSVNERNVYHELYKNYINAGGDGIIEDLAQKVVVLPTTPPQIKDQGK